MKWILLLAPLFFGLLIGYFLAPKEVSIETDSIRGADASSSKFESPMGSESAVAGEAAESSDQPIDIEWLGSINDLDSYDQIGLLYPRLKTMSASDFPALMDEMRGELYTTLGWQIRSMIAARWAQVDPQGMLAYANEQTGRSSWALYNVLFSAWAKEDASSAYQAAQQLDTRRSQRSAMQAIINTVGAEDPIRAMQIAEDYYGHGLGNQGRWMVQSIYRNWSQQDGAAARQSALAMPDGAAKSAALAGSLSDWMDEDPVTALAWLDSLPMDGSVYGSRKEVFRQFLNRDFEVARDYIESLDDPVDRREILENFNFSNLAWQKSYEEMEEVFDWIGSVATGQVYDNRVSGIIGSMAERDPDRAIDFVLSMKPGNARMNGLNALGGKLAEMDPERAFAFVQSLPYEDEKRRAMGSMAWRLSQQGAENSSRLITESTDPLVQQQLASQISSEWSNYDVAGALAWSESLSDEAARTSAIRSVLGNWIEADPSGTLYYVENSVDTTAQGSVLRDVFNTWARNDPETAAEWLGRLPDTVEGERGNIYQGVANTFVRHDPMAASEWIATLDEGPERDQSVQSLVNNISKSDPEAGFIWAETVGDDNRRRNSLMQSVQEWIKTDPEAAFEAVTDAEISAEEKVPLFQLIENQG